MDIKHKNSSLLLFFNSFYIIMLIISSSLEPSTFGNVVSLFPIVILISITIIKINVIRWFRVTKVELLIISFLLIGMILQLFFSPKFSLADYIKFIFIFILYFLGKKDYLKMESVKLYQIAIPFILLPVVSYLSFLYLSLAYTDYTGSILFFSNRNNAVAYTLVCFFVLSVLNLFNRVPVLFTLLSVITYSTLGVLLSFVTSLLITHFKLNRKNVFLLLLLVSLLLVLYFYSNLPIFERIKTLVYGIKNFVSTYELEDVKYLSFSDAVEIQGGSSDVSMFFRLKHWAEIIYIMSTNWYYLITGWGMGATVELTSMKIVPHNDWLRILFELGVFNFLAFALLNAFILFELKKKSSFLFTIFLTINIYCFSENLINNFLITSFLYYYAGLFINNENIKRRS